MLYLFAFCSVLCTLCSGSASGTELPVILPAHPVASRIFAFAHAVSSGWDAASHFVQLVNSSLAFKTRLGFYITKSSPDLTSSSTCVTACVPLLINTDFLARPLF